MSGMVIIGGGTASGAAARMLRIEGYEGEITVITREPWSLYQRPPLTKGYLDGSEGIDKVLLHPDGWYDERRVTVLTDTEAVSVDALAHTVALANGTALSYHKLLLATGSEPRLLALDGIALKNVITVRRIEDADALRELIAGGGARVVVIGGGWIGMEVASVARMLGNEVTVLSRSPIPLSRSLGDAMGALYRHVHERHGVKFQGMRRVLKLTGAERVTGVMADSGFVPADVVVVGVGAEPNLALAKSAGLVIDDGVVANASMQSSEHDIFVAGDIANALDPRIGERLRIEHWGRALSTGKTAAKAMLGQQVVHDEIPYFYSDQYDLYMELSGYPSRMEQADVVIRGSLESEKFIAFWVFDERVVAGMNVNVNGVNATVQRLIREAKPIDLTQLTNEKVPLESLVSEVP